MRPGSFCGSPRTPPCPPAVAPGVIGRRLKMDAFLDAIPQLPASLGAGAEDAHRAAIAITTTGAAAQQAGAGGRGGDGSLGGWLVGW